jgi:catechol 2,3-dioxygenase-like lactoylglutathione lyase family enzyme
MRRISLLIAVLLGVVTTPTMVGTRVHAQSGSSLANAPLTHLAIVVPDIEKVAKGYAHLWGMETPPAISKMEYQLANGKKEKVKVAYVPLPNFYLQILEPESKSGLLGTHLKKYGLGVWALGIGVDADVDKVREELVGKGGKWTVGTKGGAYAAVDFRETPLGTTLFIGPTQRPSMPEAPSEQKGLFGGLRISHVGLANSDAAASVKMYADVLGLKPAEPRRFPPDGPFPYPPHMPWTKNGWVMTSMMFSANKIGVENIQGMGGPNPWDDHIKRHGGVSIMHIAVGRGKYSHEEWLRVGQETYGGKWTNGGPPPQKMAFGYLDWSDTLGLVIE